MIAQRFSIRAIALCALCGSASLAAEEPVGVPVRIWGAGTAVSQRYGDPAVLEFATTFLESAPGAGDGAYSSWGQYTGAGAGGITVPQKTVRAEPGKRYLIDVIGDWVSYFSISTSAPAGYRVEIEGVVRKRMEMPGIGPFYYGTVAFRVLEQRASFTERAGVATQIDENKPHWSVALGFLRNGASAGALSIIDAGTGSSWSTLFTPAALQYEAPSAEIQVHRSSGAIRQILANQAAVDVVTVNSTTYELRFYNPGQVVGSSFPRTFTGDPYVVYEVTQGSTSTTLKITSKTRNVTSTTGSFSIVRTAVTTLARTGSWPTFDWTRSDWNTSGQTQVVEQFSDGSGTATARVENLEIRPGGSTTEAISVQRTYKLYGWGEQLEKEKLGTGAYVETTRDYYTTSSEPGRYGFLKSVKETGDNWTAYDYWDSGTAGAKTGQIKYKFRPWLGSPSTISFTTTTGEVTYYEYVADPWGANTRPSLVETKVNNVLTAKSTTSYSDVGTANGMTLVQAVRNDYSNSTNYLTTTTRYYKENTADAFYRSQVHSVVQPGNLKTSFLRQRGTWSGGTFTKSANGGTADGTASRIAIISGTTATGTLRSTEDGYDIDDLYLVTGQSTMAVTIRDSSALIVRTESHVWTGSAWALIGSNNNTYTYAGQLLQSTANNGAVRDWSWNGEQLASQTDEAGVVVSYSLYDHAGRVKEVTKLDGPTTEFTYNAAGKVTQETLKRTTTNETITVTREFDDAGRLIKETPPGLGDTEFSYDPANRTRTTELADGGTRVDTYLLDGRLEKITGDGVVEQFYSYAIESDGRRRTEVNVASSTSGRWSKTWTDWLGRTIQEDVPTWNSSSPSTRAHTYDSAGRLWKTTQPGLAATLRTYDSMGNLSAQGLDINGTADSLDAGSDDRITLYSTTIYENGTGVWWLKQTESTYPISMDGTTLKELGRTETKLTSFPTNRLSHVEAFDIYGNKTETYTVVDRGNKTLTSTINPPDSTTDAYQKTVNGLLTESQDSAGVKFTFTYDLLDRLSTSADPRTASQGSTTTAYISGTARIESVTDPASVVQAIYNYDTLGRTESVSVPNPNYSPPGDTRTRLMSYTSYTLKGQVKQQWGDTAYPVEFTYDDYGQQTGMTTYATSTANFTTSSWPTTTPDNPQTTTWTFDEETGLLESKTDAAGKAVDYTYTSAGQVFERKWARTLPDTTRVTTTYSYSATTGEVTLIDYNDSTSDITPTYNRLGALSTVYDNSGSRSFTYNLSSTLELQREDLPALSASRRLTYEYDTATGFKGRPKAFKLGTSANPALDQSVGYTYQEDGRLDGVDLGSTHGIFEYTYVGDSHFVSQTQNTTLNWTQTRSYLSARDLVNKVETKIGTTSKAKFDYDPANNGTGYDALGRSTKVAKTGEMFNRYGDGTEGIATYFTYDDKSQLTSDVTKVGATSTELAGRKNTSLAYDKLGNRTSVTHNDTTSSYSVNSLNQYYQRTGTGVVDLAGAADAASTVYANGVSPSRHGKYFFKDFQANGTASPRMINSVAGVTPAVKSINGNYGFNWPYQPVSAPTVTGPNGTSVQVLEFGGSANHIGMEKLADNWPPGFNYTFQNGRTYVFGFWARTTSGTRTITPMMTDHINDGATGATHSIDTSWKWVTVTKQYSNVGSNPRLFYTWDSGGVSFQVYGAMIADITSPLDASVVTGFTPGASEGFSYDADGNLKSDGRWDYAYDAENRVRWMNASSAAVAAGHPNVGWIFQYDYLGRRNYKQPCIWNGSAYQADGPEQRFVYNGWNLVAEFAWNSQTSTYDLKRSYTWGMDIAGPGQRAGGIGGLLLIKDGSNTYVPAYDGMGNLHALMTTAQVTFGTVTYAAGDIVAAYEYDAFGQTIRESGPYAASNPFRFSTKFTDTESGLVYFGLRYYSPSLGRFINRDPIEESGGLNLYGYCGNNAANRWDYLGMLPEVVRAERPVNQKSDSPERDVNGQGFDPSSLLTNGSGWGNGYEFYAANLRETSKQLMMRDYLEALRALIKAAHQVGRSDVVNAALELYDRLTGRQVPEGKVTLGPLTIVEVDVPYPEAVGTQTTSESSGSAAPQNSGSSPARGSPSAEAPVMSFSRLPWTVANGIWGSNIGGWVRVDAASLGISVDVSQFEGIGEDFAIDVAAKQDFIVHGTVRVELWSDGFVRVQPEQYDFDQKPDNGTIERTLRNTATYFALWLAGPGTPFSIEYTGTITPTNRKNLPIPLSVP